MSDSKQFAARDDATAWCPGCGDFAILEAIKMALAESGLSPSKAVLVSGIGQAGKLPHYMRVNTFNTIHGRTLPTAAGIKLSNPELTVLTVGGDGDGYAEGGNHLLHALRRNLDMTVIVCDNRVFGLTKGQASPTSEQGRVGGITPAGTAYPDFNPLLLGIVMEAALVARGFSGEKEHLADLVAQGINTPGLALIDILQPCVSFNKVNTWQWYRQRVDKLEDHQPEDREKAMELARQWGDNIPLGVIYKSGRTSPTPTENLVTAELNPADVDKLLDQYRVNQT